LFLLARDDVSHQGLRDLGPRDGVKRKRGTTKEIDGIISLGEALTRVGHTTHTYRCVTQLEKQCTVHVLYRRDGKIGIIHEERGKRDEA